MTHGQLAPAIQRATPSDESRCPDSTALHNDRPRSQFIDELSGHLSLCQRFRSARQSLLSAQTRGRHCLLSSLPFEHVLPA